MNSFFKICDGKGFHLPLPNGWAVSVQFGPGNYCTHYDARSGYDERLCGENGSGDVEVAVINPQGNSVETPFSMGDTVHRYQSPRDVLNIILWASTMKKAGEDDE